MNFALRESLKFIHKLTSNYDATTDEIIQLLSTHNTKYRAINNQKVFEEAKRMNISINNIKILFDLVESTALAKESQLQITKETIKQLEEEAEKLSELLRNLKGIGKILKPIVNQYSNENFLAFKKKYEHQ